MEALTLRQTGKGQVVPVIFVDLPGLGYWRDWLNFVRGRMLERGYISDHDLDLFKVVEDVELAVQEIRNF
jgi:hypothetical protein